jgi:hypothetical protein
MGVQLPLFAPKLAAPAPKADLLSLLPPHARIIAARMAAQGLNIVASPPHIGAIRSVNGRTFLADYGPELFREGDGWRSARGRVWWEVGVGGG